jgi:hypothetical protein
MNLYIKVKDGQVIGDPHLEDNMIQIIEGFDSNNLPNEWAKFIRVLNPHNEQLLYNEFVFHSYEFDSVNNAWTDTWTVKTMTEEELTNKKETHKKQIQNEFQPFINQTNSMIDSFITDDELTKKNKFVWTMYLKLLNLQLTKYLDSFDSPDGPIHAGIPPIPVKDPNNPDKWIAMLPPLDIPANI